MARSQLLAVQVLRAFAALAVVVHHAQHDAGNLAERTGQAFARSELLPWLAGVDIFFVVSGFIMVYASADLFGRPDAARTFAGRRVARIVPLYWAVTSLYLAVALVLPQTLNSARPGALDAAASYLFIPFTRADGNVQPVYSLGWTLNYEMFFYAVFALAIVLPRGRAVAAVTATLTLAVVLGRLLDPLPQPLAFWSQPIVLEFVFGMGLGLLRAHGATLPLAVRIGLAITALVLLGLDLTRSDGAVVLPQFLAYGAPAAMLVAAAGFEGEGGRPPRFERAIAALGDASYAIYLVHPFVIRALHELFLRNGLGAALGPWVFMAVAFLAAIAASLLVHRLFERPATRALRGALRV